MKTLIASSVGLAAMTSLALAEEPAVKGSQSADTDLLRLTDSQMDGVTAAGDQTNNNDCLLVCNNNNQNTESGSNTSGDQTIGVGDIDLSLGL